MLWYPVGWTAGYLVLLCLVAAPLRRSGAYTLPDFAEARLDSRGVRRVSALLVVVIGWLYLMPQFQGAGVALRTTTGLPPWAGGLVVAVVVLLNVLAGGMRSITFVQAFQYWLKLTALLVPLVFLVLVWLGDGGRSPADPALVARGGDGAGLGRPDRLRRRPPAVLDVLPDGGDVPRHHGPAPRGGALLHQPRRPRRPPDHAGGARAARALLRAAAGVRRPRASLRPRPRRRRARQRRARAARADDRRAGRRPAHRAADRRRVRGLPGDVLGAHRGGGRGDHPGRRSRRLEGVTAFRLAAVVAVVVPFALAWSPARPASPPSSAWPSPWRPRPSARCCCSASGGAA